MEQKQKEVVQALLIADNFNENFMPFTNKTNVSLLSVVNTPLIDYTLEALNRSGVEEVFVFCSTFKKKVKEHIIERIANKCSWSVDMIVHVIGSEGVRCLGDALRDIDAKGLLRGHFILMGCDTVTNANLGTILEQHRRKCKFDKGAALTVVYKKNATNLRTGDEVVIATDRDSNRLLFHQRLKPSNKERYFSFPLETFLINTEVTLYHDLMDPQIAICAPTVLPLFTDNFDFETRDDFIRGLLINEEILGNTIYYAELQTEQYAGLVSNWQTYQIISNDIINRWVYPLVPDMGICSLRQHYLFLRNNVYKSKDVQLARSVQLQEDVVVHEKCTIDDGTLLTNSVVGRNCNIGKGCVLDHAYVFDNVTIGDNCTLRYCVIGRGSKVQNDSEIIDGCVIGDCVVIEPNSKIAKHFVQSTPPDYDDESIKLGPSAYTISDREVDEEDLDSDDENEQQNLAAIRMSILESQPPPSSYYSSSSDEEQSGHASPLPDDTNIFLSEVIDSLMRGYNEKSNPDFLILEINSSRYAYNMTLNEVNFFVVKAFLSLQPIIDAADEFLGAFKRILQQLGAVLKNYIRGEEAMRDCLKAIEEMCEQNENIKAKVAQIIHYLYDKEILSEDSILGWHNEIDDDNLSSKWLKQSMKKLVDWLMASSEEESSEDDENN